MNLKILILSVILLILTGIVTYRCEKRLKEFNTKENINCEYHNGIILHKETILGTTRYTIEKDGKVYDFVPVYDIDAIYNIGDTINKPCRTK